MKSPCRICGNTGTAAPAWEIDVYLYEYLYPYFYTNMLAYVDEDIVVYGYM